MLRRPILIVFLFLLGYAIVPGATAQKPPIDFSVVDSWQSLGRSTAISNDGKVVVYDVVQRYQPVYSVIHHNEAKWDLQIPGVQNIVINGDSRFVLFNKKDSLFIYDVTKRVYLPSIAGITSFKIPADAKGRWLAYLVKDQLTLRDLFKDTETMFDGVTGYQFSENGEQILLQRKKGVIQNLQLVNSANGKMKQLSIGVINPRSFVFDRPAKQMAFLADEVVDGQTITVLRYFREEMDSSIVRVNAFTPGMKKEFTVAAGALRFSPNGKRLFFPLKLVQPILKPLENAADLNLWHYKDIDLPAEQEADIRWSKMRTFTAVINYNSDHVVIVNTEKDGSLVVFGDKGNADYAVVRNDLNAFSALREDNVPAYYLVSLVTGERRVLISKADITVTLSPGGNYAIWYDADENAWYTKDILKGGTTNVTSSIGDKVSFVQPQFGTRLKVTVPCGIGGWLPGDKSVLIYDRFDIWKIDPSGKDAPVNLTRGYGQNNNILLRIWNETEEYEPSLITENKLLLVAFNDEDKRNGFFSTDLTGKSDPVKHSLDPWLYYQHSRFQKQFFSFAELYKAKEAPVYLVTRENSSESPNLFVTRDFSNFEQVSKLEPQKKYNWLTSELLNYTRSDGRRGQAVLYKPEDFDPNKKYPVIFYFYEKMSHRLHQFLEPELSIGSISIPIYVSNGYLVCTPDIDFRQGETGESILNSVVSAARYLSKYNWVDSTKMGLQGHSFGGYGVNYIIAHSSMFAAAQESSGSVDWISHYNSNYRENSAQFYFEIGQARLGKTLWEDPQLFIKNSPIFRAPDVSTPLLIMHNKEDGEVPFQQGYEWFTALRRLKKKVWMLQYDKEAHAINQKKNQLDFSIRTMQFFDHYLKAASMPKWMASGIPMNLKYIETGLELQR